MLGALDRATHRPRRPSAVDPIAALGSVPPGSVVSSLVLSGSRNRDPDVSRAAAYGIPVADRSVRPGTWSAERVLDALHDWTREVGRAPFAYEWSPGGSRAAGRSSRVWERWAREYPRWPEARTVAHYHRTWGAALLVAGLAGGREPLELSLNERVEAARRMAAAGFSAAQIGDEVGVCGGKVGRYLRAHTCRCGRNWVVERPVWAVRARAGGPLGAAALGAGWRDRGADAVAGA